MPASGSFRVRWDTSGFELDVKIGEVMVDGAASRPNRLRMADPTDDLRGGRDACEGPPVEIDSLGREDCPAGDADLDDEVEVGSV